MADGKITAEEKTAIVTAVIAAAVSSGQTVTAEQIQSAGIEYKDLPKETPVELRTDINGNSVVITAEVAAQVELLQDPGALLSEALSNPGAAIAALGSIGADMSEEERTESQKIVVAAVIAGQAAINAATMAAASAATGAATSAATSAASTSGGSTGGGTSPKGGGTGGGPAAGGDKPKRTFRRRVK